MIYVYLENSEGIYTKGALEAVSYARSLSNISSDEVVAVGINLNDDENKLAKLGANKVINIQSDNLKNFDSSAYAKAISSIINGNITVFTHSNDSVSVAAQLSVLQGAALISNVVEVPSSLTPFTVNRKAFSGKATMNVSSNNSKIIVTILPNSVGIKENETSITSETISVEEESKLKVVSSEKSSGKIQLKDAEIVVSAGRGLKAAENWTMIEELAAKLNAATACSKPVSDIGWRPHAEHVGQTGKTIAPNLYFAIGISGAIQHLAGVNGSKTIVVINNDSEAPFFKSADYGVVGDAFEVIPKLNQLL